MEQKVIKFLKRIWESQIETESKFGDHVLKPKLSPTWDSIENLYNDTFANDSLYGPCSMTSGSKVDLRESQSNGHLLLWRLDWLGNGDEN